MMTQAELIPKDDVAVGLLKAGLPVGIVAKSLGVSAQSIHLIARTKVTTPAEEEIAEQVRELVQHAIREAWWEIEYGPYPSRIAFLKLLVGNAARKYAGGVESDKFEELRLMWEDTAAQIRGPAFPEDPFDDDDTDDAET